MRAPSQPGQCGAAASADVARCAVAGVAADGEGPVGHEAGVADVVGRRQREEEVEHHAHASQPGHVGGDVGPVEAPPHVVEHGQGRDAHEPHARHEDRQDEREAEGVERGVIVEFHPRFGHEVLQAAVERGGSRDGQAEQGGIEAADVVEVDDVQVAPAGGLDEEKGHHEHHDAEGQARAAAAERVDELRDGVVGHGGLGQAALAGPAHRGLVACQFEPDAVRRVFRHEGYVGHDDLVATPHDGRVGPRVEARCARPAGHEGQGVGGDFEVEVGPVVVVSDEGGRVEAAVAYGPAVVGRRRGVVAGGGHERRDHEGEEGLNVAHGRASGSGGNRNSGGSAVRRAGGARGVRARGRGRRGAGRSGRARRAGSGGRSSGRPRVAGGARRRVPCG